MKKVLPFLVIISLATILFFLLNDKGNRYLQPYIGTYLEKRFGYKAIKVEDLKIDLNYIRFVVLLNRNIRLDTKGFFSLFSQTIELDYTLKGDFEESYSQIDINGIVRGKFNDLEIQGEGQGLGSHINYALNIKNEVINNINIKINKADITSLLELAAQPAYAKGKVDIDINIPTLEEMDTKGKAKIVLHSTTLNEQVFQEVFKLNLPKKSIVTANIDSTVSANAFMVNGEIKSNLASIKLTQTNYDLKRKKLLGNYQLNIPKLSKLSFLTQQKLQGKMELKGRLIVTKDSYNIQGMTKSIGGKSSFNFNGKQLKMNMSNVEISKLLHLLNQKPYASGKLMAEAKLDNVKDLNGHFKIETKEAKINHATVKKEMKLDLGESIAFTLLSEGEITSNVIHMQNKLNSDILNYRSDDMQYQLKNASLISSYNLEIPKLSKLSSLVNRPLRGTLVINGAMNYHKNLELIGVTKSLGGKVDFKLLNEKLHAKIADVPVEKLMHTLSYPQLFKALLVGDFNYDLTTQKGTFNSKLNKAQLLENQLTILVKQIRGVDLSKERYNETEFHASLNKNLIDIHFKAKSKTALLEIPSGRINKANNHINANYIVNIENKDIGGKIQGDISKPKITIDSSNFIKEKVIDFIKENIPSDALKDLGIEKIETDAIKDTLNNLLGDLFK